MADKNKHIHRDDEFSNLIRQKLENHQLPVPDDIWAGIEQKMTPKSSKKRLIPMYWIAGGVAAAVALLLLLVPVQDISQLAPTVSSTYEKSKDVEPKPAVDAEEPASDSADSDYEKNPQSIPAENGNSAGLIPVTHPEKSHYADHHTHTHHSRATRTKEKTAPIGEVSSTANAETVSVSTTHDVYSVKPAEGEESRTEQGAATSPVEKPIQKIDKLPDLNDYPEIPEPSKKTRKKQKVLLAAAFGTGGNVSSSSQTAAQQSHSTIPQRQLVSSDVARSYSGILTADDYSESKHYAPVSAGFMVEMPITKRFGVESGLVYTYLKSHLNKSGLVDCSGTLELHYLGVPLNARFKAINKSQWNLYVSGGGMVEKGLRSFYHQKVEDPSMNRETVVKSGIDGLQWSLNGAVGVDFKLNKDLSLFLEPKVTYYLENNQPQSARTEQPVTIGFTGGIRVEL